MKLKVITSNPGKVEEFRQAFEGLGIEMEHLHIPYDEPQTSELEGVVRKGLEEIRSKGYRDFIIDDSGMFVKALKGFPGVYSAYVQKTIGNGGVLQLMDGEEDRAAEFRCCIGCDIGGRTVIVTGVCKGTILREESGCGGFGYDPIFSPDGSRSFAEMSTDEKNTVSHRGNAIRLLREKLTEIGLPQR